jgi:hypothetical protein
MVSTVPRYNWWKGSLWGWWAGLGALLLAAIYHLGSYLFCGDSFKLVLTLVFVLGMIPQFVTIWYLAGAEFRQAEQERMLREAEEFFVEMRKRKSKSAEELWKFWNDRSSHK